jgi:predicted dehydrogenase
MLDKSKIDAVVIGTPMHLHASQSIEALKRNIHVLSEVTAGVSIDECKALAACRTSLLRAVVFRSAGIQISI